MMSSVVILALTLLVMSTSVSASMRPSMDGGNFSQWIDFRLVGDVSIDQPLLIRSTTESNYTLAARIGINASLETTGWDYVEVQAEQSFLTGSYTDKRFAYYAVGYAEGYETYKRIHDNAENVLTPFWNMYVSGNKEDSTFDSSNPVGRWIDDHIKYMESVADAPQSDFDRQIGKLMSQLKGLNAGYNKAIDDNKQPSAWKFSFHKMFMLNFQEETWDVHAAVSSDTMLEMIQRFPNLNDGKQLGRLRGHCSALVKKTDNDLFVAHDTWSDYNAMIRQYKTYVFETTVTMSSYPGLIDSLDDWYMTSNGLAVQETTNEMYNVSLLREYVAPGNQTISEFFRVMAANYLAGTGPEWVQHFSDRNSGTYNNQYMIVDMDLVAFKEPTMPPNTFWVAEQIPGTIFSADMTQHLDTHTYWASYNIPYFKAAYNLSGTGVEFNKTDDNPFFSYTGYARAVQFRNLESNISTLEDMQYVMRYNRYKTDPSSLITGCEPACNPAYSANLAIAARGDLNPADGFYPTKIEEYVDRGAFGAIDTKITSYQMMKNRDRLRGLVISGPSTSVDLPPFSWDGSNFTDKHVGMPSTFDFGWVDYDIDVRPNLAPGASTPSSKLVIILAACVAGVAIILVVVVLVFRGTCGKEKKKAPTVDEGSPLM